MLISLNWIKDFVDIPQGLSKRELSKRLTLATAEVEETRETGTVWPHVEVVEVTGKKPHPNADTLWLVDFQMQGGRTHWVVCGAPNVEVGMKAAFVPLGATLPTGLTLEAKEIRGIKSEGMLCSEYELGLSDEAEGIIHLHSDAPVGQKLDQYLKEYQSIESDVIFDIDNKSLTHRPDLWGHYGMAREFAAIFETKLSNTFKKGSKESGDPSPIQIKVDPDSACLGYFGLSIDGIEIGPSPAWMQARLSAVGLRPINNIVDVSNYVMLELGHPLHIFDRESIRGGQVHIRLAHEGERLTTLDEIERQLVPTDTVIADQKGALVLAGVMGGLHSGVSEDTQKIFIEVANWMPGHVRATSTRLGLRTEACQRFEKGLDSLSMERVLWRTWELVCEFCPQAKVVGKREYDGPNLSEIKPLSVSLEWAHLQSVLGAPLDKAQVSGILERLDFQVERQTEVWNVRVPSYRATRDIEGPADLIEEVGRMIGYGNIPTMAPRLEVRTARLTPAQILHRTLREGLVWQAGAFEIQNYPLIGDQLLSEMNWPSEGEGLKLLNAPSRDCDQMRPSLLPGLLKTVQQNAKREAEFRLFEIGRSYLPDGKDFRREISQLAVAFYQSGVSPFRDLANTLDRLMRACGYPIDWVERDAPFPTEVITLDWKGLHPFEFYHIRLMGKLKGALFSLHPSLARKLKLKGHLAVAILNLDSAEKVAVKNKIRYQPLPKFPATAFDYTVELGRKAPVAQVLTALKSLKIRELTKSTVVDVFEPKEGDFKYVTLRSHLQDKKKTLSSEALESAEKRIVAHLEKTGFPLKAGG